MEVAVNTFLKLSTYKSRTKVWQVRNETPQHQLKNISIGDSEKMPGLSMKNKPSNTLWDDHFEMQGGLGGSRGAGPIFPKATRK